jgi:hypothetical protein
MYFKNERVLYIANIIERLNRTKIALTQSLINVLNVINLFFYIALGGFNQRIKFTFNNLSAKNFCMIKVLFNQQFYQY